MVKFAKVILLFSLICLLPINAAQRDSKDIDTPQTLKMRKTTKHFNKKPLIQTQQPENKKPQQVEDPLKDPLKDPVQARNRLQILICSLGHEKDKLQKTYTYWALSTLHAVNSFPNFPGDVLYRCLHVAIHAAPYIAPYLPSRIQPYFHSALNGTNLILEGVRAVVHTKQWAWEQILGYSALAILTIMKPIPQDDPTAKMGVLITEMEGAIYFLFKAAGYYHYNYSLPYLPDSLWQELMKYSSGTITVEVIPDEYTSHTWFNMSETKKKGIHQALGSAFHEAHYCQPDFHKILDQAGHHKTYQKEITSCNSIVRSWEKLKPNRFEARSFSLDSSSDVLVVNQRQYAVVNLSDSKQILVTANIMKCVGITLYNPETNTCGLVHLDGENLGYVDSCLVGNYVPSRKINHFQTFILDVAGKTSFNKIRATIVGGFSPHINYFKKYIEICGLKNIDIIHNIEWGKDGNGYEVSQTNIFTGKRHLIEIAKGSIAIDCHNGMVNNVKNEPEVRKAMGMPPKGDRKSHPIKKIVPL